MYAARKQGFWKDRGLDVSISRGFGSSNASKTVGLGRYDFGQADIAAMLKGAAAGLPLVSIGMVNQRSPICIVTLEDSGIRAPKDLEGHKLGGSPGGGTRNLWPAFAKANNIDRSKVKIWMPIGKFPVVGDSTGCADEPLGQAEMATMQSISA